jgi:hypothetical protein
LGVAIVLGRAGGVCFADGATVEANGCDLVVGEPGTWAGERVEGLEFSNASHLDSVLGAC